MFERLLEETNRVLALPQFDKNFAIQMIRDEREELLRALLARLLIDYIHDQLSAAPNEPLT